VAVDSVTVREGKVSTLRPDWRSIGTDTAR
jgi:hypothetical protein